MKDFSSFLLAGKNKYISGIILLFLVILCYRYVAPFGEVVSYRLNDNKIDNIQGVESREEFKKNANVLLSIPEQIIRKNIVTFNVKPQHAQIDKVGVFLRFKGNPKELRVGIRGSEKQKYVYKSLYNEILNNIPFIKDQNISFWQKKQTFKNISDFAKHVPSSGLIGYYLFDPLQLSTYVSEEQSGANETTTIDHTLRGTQTFYVKVTQLPFSFHIEKQDANQYPGEDRLLITVEKNKQVIEQKEVGDDTIVNNSSLKLTPQAQDITVNTTEKGVYKITLKDESQGSDIRITKIVVNQKFVMFASPIFIVDSTPTVLVTDTKNISLQTSHKESLQVIKLDNKYDVSVDKSGSKIDFNLDLPFVTKAKIGIADNKKQTHILSFPKNDVLIRGDGYFAFSENSYFSLKLSNFVDIASVKSIDSLDYVIANYQPTRKKNGWNEAFVTFSSKEFKTEGDVVYFSLESPELSSFGGEIIIDALEVSIRKP